jgi:hypothetical protein
MKTNQTAATAQFPSRTAAQSKALDDMRKAKAAAAAAAPEATVGPTAKPEAAAESPTMRERLSNLSELMSSVYPSDENVSLKRYWSAFAASCLAGGALTYGIMAVVNTAMIACAVYTGSLLLTMMVLLVGIIVAIYAATKVSNMVSGYIMESRLDADIASVKATVTGWFTRKPAAAPAA